jgi:hypothetical protein
VAQTEFEKELDDGHRVDWLPAWTINKRYETPVFLLAAERGVIGVGQGRAARSNRRAIRDRRRHTDSVRITSSLRADIIFGKNRY